MHRYNHNLEAGRSYFPQVVTSHSFEERWDTCLMVKESGMELCCGGLVGMGETLEQRAELAAQLSELEPHEVPLKKSNSSFRNYFLRLRVSIWSYRCRQTENS